MTPTYIYSPHVIHDLLEKYNEQFRLQMIDVEILNDLVLNMGDKIPEKAYLDNHCRLISNMQKMIKTRAEHLRNLDFSIYSYAKNKLKTESKIELTY